MKSVFTIVFCLCCLGFVSGCGVNDTPSEPVATARTHFFPLNDGTIYTYSRFNHNRIDTFSYLLHVGQTIADPTFLINSKPNGTNPILYYLSYSKDAQGNRTGVLSTDTS